MRVPQPFLTTLSIHLVVATSAAAAAAALTTSHVVIRQVSLPAMTCDGSTMNGFIALNSFAVTSLCSAYVSCEDAGAAGGGAPREFDDLAPTAQAQAREIGCVAVCRCLPRSSAAAAAVAAAVANGTETRVVNGTVKHSLDG